MKAVNLLPGDEAAGRSFGGRDPVLVFGAVATFAVVLGTAGGFLLAHEHAGSARQQLSFAQQQLSAAQAKQQRDQQAAKANKPVLPTPSVTSQEKPWRDAVASAMSTRIAFDVVLAQFERVVPDDITLTELTMDAPAPGAGTTSTAPTGGTATGGAFTLSGTAFSEDSVARLMSRLMLVPSLTGVSLLSSSADPHSGIVTFQINAQVKGSPSTDTTDSTGSASTTTTSTTSGTSM